MLALHHLDRAVGIDRELGAERAHEVEACLADVDPDDAISETGQQLHGVVTEAAGRADDGDRSSRQHAVLQHLLHRAVRGEAAAGERRLGVGDAVGQDHEARRVHDELLGERAHHVLRLRAEARLAAEAELARAAPEPTAAAAEADDHAIADLHEPVGAGTEVLDDADRLVPEARRLHAVPVPAGEVQVGVADTGGGDAEQRLIDTRCRGIDVVDPELTVEHTCSLHAVILLRS